MFLRQARIISQKLEKSEHSVTPGSKTSFTELSSSKS